MSILAFASRASSLVVVAALALAACHGDPGNRGATGTTVAAAATGSSGAGNGSSASDDSIMAQPALPDPCSLLPIDDAKRLLGPLSGPPWRARNLDDTTSKSDGSTCVYPLKARENVAEHSAIALELKIDGAIGFEAGAAMMNGVAKGLLGSLGVKTADGARHDVDGWDYLGGFTDRMAARVGHVAIAAKWERARGAADSLLEIMAIMRDHIPDSPFRSDERGSKGADGDACSLLTREEAEAVVGKLVVPPYHSRNLTGLADSDGDACTYYTSRHHVLSIAPSWSHGKQLFKLNAGLSQGVQSKVGVTGEAADTLEGNWDQAAANMGGDLYFLKGDRMLAISYRMSATDKAGALKLASSALERLAKAP